MVNEIHQHTKNLKDRLFASLLRSPVFCMLSIFKCSLNLSANPKIFPTFFKRGVLRTIALCSIVVTALSMCFKLIISAMMYELTVEKNGFQYTEHILP